MADDAPAKSTRLPPYALDARTRRAGYAMVAAAALLWGSWTLVLRPAGLDPRWTSVIVLATMSVLPVPLLLTRPGPRGRTRGEWGLLALFGLSDAANVALFFAALDRTTNAVAVLSHYLAPALVALLAPLIVGTRFRLAALPRAALATLGLVLVLEPWRIAHLAPRHVAGAGFGAASAVFYAVCVCITKRLATRFTAEELLVYHSAISAAALALFAPWHSPPPLAGALAVVGAGVVIGALGSWLFTRGVARVPAEHAAVLTFLEPLMAVAIGAVVFGERLGALTLVGGAVVLGVGLATTRAE